MIIHRGRAIRQSIFSKIIQFCGIMYSTRHRSLFKMTKPGQIGPFCLTFWLYIWLFSGVLSWEVWNMFEDMMTSSNGNIFRVSGPLWGNHRSPVDFPHKGQWRGALMFSLICDWVHNQDAGDLGRHRAHYDVTVMKYLALSFGMVVLKFIHSGASWSRVLSFFGYLMNTSMPSWYGICVCMMLHLCNLWICLYRNHIYNPNKHNRVFMKLCSGILSAYFTVWYLSIYFMLSNMGTQCLRI